MLGQFTDSARKTWLGQVSLLRVLEGLVQVSLGQFTDSARRTWLGQFTNSARRTLLGQVSLLIALERLGQVRLGQVRLGQDRLGQVRFGQFSDSTRTWLVTFTLVYSQRGKDLVRLGQFTDSAETTCLVKVRIHQINESARRTWFGQFKYSARNTWLFSANSENFDCQIQDQLGCCFVEQKRKVVYVSHHWK